MRKIVFALLVVAVGSMALAVWALAATTSRQGGVRVTRQAFVWENDARTTTDVEFTELLPADRAIPPALTVTNRGRVTMTFSGDFSGAPVELRARQGGGRGARILQPEAASFDPSNGTTSVSFTFVLAGANNHSAGCRSYAIDWRSPTGEAVTFNRGNVVLTYRHDDTNKDGLRFACL